MSARRVLFVGLVGLGLYLIWRQSQASQGPLYSITLTDLTNSGGAGENAIDTAAQTVVTGVTDIMTNSTRGERNNNPGNIVWTPSINWVGQIGHDSRFVIFDTPQNGIRALAKLLTNYIGQGYNTIYAIINRWAPSVENNTAAYISDVSAKTGIAPNIPVTVEAVPAIAQAIIVHENGRVAYSPEILAAGFSAAGINVA